MTPSQTEIDTILELVRNTPENERSDLEKAALQEFRDSYFKFDGLQPSWISAALSHQPKELTEIYHLLLREDQRKNPPAAKAPEIYALENEGQAALPVSPKNEIAVGDVELDRLVQAALDEVGGAPLPQTSPKAPNKKRVKASVIEEGDEEEMDLSGGDDTPRKPRTALGDAISTLDAAGRLDDAQIGQMLDSREEAGRWGRRVGLLGKLTLAAGLATGVVLGGRAAWQAKIAAEKTGGEVQKIQDNVGNFADEIGPNPFGAKTPRQQNAPKDDTPVSAPATKKGR